MMRSRNVNRRGPNVGFVQKGSLGVGQELQIPYGFHEAYLRSRLSRQ